MSKSAEPSDLLDLGCYPLHDLSGPRGRALLAAARARFTAEGVLTLPGFVVPPAVATLCREVEALLPQAYYCAQDHNPYLVPDDPALPPDHPRNRPQVSDKGCLADDLIPPESGLRRLYDWPPMRVFLAALLGVPTLYRYDDPLGSLNVNVFREGQQLGWHFDNAAFATTLMLQEPGSGGVFEFVPAIRTTQNENYPAIAEALSGAGRDIRQLAIAAGTLVLFRGRYSLHRVTPVVGSRPRLIAVLSYDTRPGVMLTEHTRRLFYGRAA